MLHLTGRIVRTVVFKVVAASVVFLMAGNLAILAASYVARHTTSAMVPETLSGIDNLRAVDAKLWRGGAPTPEGYQRLADAGTTTVIDLRAESGLEQDDDLVRSLGMNLVQIPIRDGQVPSREEVDTFIAAARDAGGLVFVHCGAGVGRTGAMIGAYLVAGGGLNGIGAIRQNLAVGPPSLEQLAFVAGLGDGRADKPGTVLTAVSRVLDAPRRLWSRFG